MQGPVLVATDFSARADRAVDRAIMLGQQLGSKVVLVHALDYKQSEVFDKSRLDKQMRAVLPEGIAGAEAVEFLYTEGAAPQALAEAAKTCGASIVVMGPARHNSLRDYLLGTAVDYTLRNCSQPVLVVKQRPHRPYGKIILATDFSVPSAKALMQAIQIFPDAEFHLVHGCHVPFDAWQKAPYVREEVLDASRAGMDRFVKDLAIDEGLREGLHTHVDIGLVYGVVNGVAAKTGADLVVIGSHGESGFRHATIGSVANELLTTTLVDTLMITARD